MLPLQSLPAAPKPGQRIALPEYAASADALAIAQLADGKRLLAVVAASPLEAQRLAEEIAWFAPDLRVHLLPDWETLPYDHFSPHQDLISERLATLFAVTQGQCDVLIVAASTAATRLAPPAFLAAHTFFMKKGDKLDLAKLRAQMTLAGYQHVTQVVAPGEYSVRGGLIDLFPMGTSLPYRIELFDDEIETMRSFDVDSQRTLYPVPEIRLLPAREMPAGEAGRTTFRQRFRDTFEGDASRIALYKDVSNGIMPAGIEYYLPLFFDDRTAPRCSTTCRRKRPCCCTATYRPRSPSSGPTCRGATRCLAATVRVRCCRRRNCFCATKHSSSPPIAFAQFLQKVGAGETATIAHRWRLTARPTIRWPRCGASSTTSPVACCCWPNRRAGAKR